MTPDEFAASHRFAEGEAVYLRLALVANLFWSMEDGDTSAGAGLIRDVWPFMKSSARMYQTTWMKRPAKLNLSARARIFIARMGAASADYDALIVDNREAPDGIGVEGFDLVGAPHRGVGYLALRFDPSRSAHEVQDQLLAWTDGLPYLHGFLGYGLVYNDLGAFSTRASQPLYDLGMRHTGLDIQSPSNTSFVASRGMKGVNWLTFIGDDLASRSGVLKKASHESGRLTDDNLQIYRQKRGWVIQAGEQPRIGDREAGDLCDDYRVAARRLADLRVRDHPEFIWHETLPMGSEERTQAWLGRHETGAV